MHVDPGFIGTWMGTLVSVVSLAVAIWFYRRSSKSLAETRDRLLNETTSLREATQFVIRALSAMGYAEPITDDLGLPQGYRVRDAAGSEALYDVDASSGTTTLRVIRSRPQSVTPEWELSGLSEPALKLYIWMSYRVRAAEDEDRAAVFAYRAPSDENSTWTICHSVSKQRYTVCGNLLQELLSRMYIELLDADSLQEAGLVTANVEEMERLFPWMRDQ